jgi:hypothetical protein
MCKNDGATSGEHWEVQSVEELMGVLLETMGRGGLI